MATRIGLTLAEGPHRVFVGVAPDDHLGDHDRNPDGRNAEDEEEHEGSATMHAGDVREFPDIAEPDRRAGRSHDEAEAAAPESAFRLSVMFFHGFLLLPDYCFWGAVSYCTNVLAKRGLGGKYQKHEMCQ